MPTIMGSEMDMHHAGGLALDSSLDLDKFLADVHAQVSPLVSPGIFYVALYDEDAKKITFPLAVDGGERVGWESRRVGRGVIEHVLHIRAPLLIHDNVGDTLDALGLDQLHRSAASWLGVPIMAGSEALGVIAIQSESPSETYDGSHQEILARIAAERGSAIGNAYLHTRTSEALALRTWELDAILKTASEGILILDRDWRVLDANQALADLLGATPEAFVGQTLDATSPDADPSLAGLFGYTAENQQADRDALTRGEAIRKQIIALPGEQERHAERVLVAIPDSGDPITGWLLVLRDLSGERGIGQLRDELTDMMVHDLRSPLTALMGSVEMLKIFLTDRIVSERDGELEDTRELLALAEQSTNRMLRIVDALLDISKLESGQMPVNQEVMAVRPLLKNIVSQFRPLVSVAKIDLEISADPDLPLLYVDPDLITRVLSNLLDNAIKFTPDGGHIEVWARLDPETTPVTMLIGVSDSGPGIPPLEQDRLFKKFQQVSTTRGRRSGTGLGLPFCKLAVEAHGGEIWTESEVGAGATLIVRLPTRE